MIIGLILVAVGVIALLVHLGVLSGSVWGYTWPVILIILGLSFLVGGRRRSWLWWSWRGWRSPDEEEKR